MVRLWSLWLGIGFGLVTSGLQLARSELRATPDFIYLFITDI